MFATFYFFQFCWDGFLAFEARPLRSFQYGTVRVPVLSTVRIVWTTRTTRFTCIESVEVDWRDEAILLLIMPHNLRMVPYVLFSGALTGESYDRAHNEKASASLLLSHPDPDLIAPVH